MTAQIAARVEMLAGDRTERAEALLRAGSDELARLGETGYLSTNEGHPSIDPDRPRASRKRLRRRCLPPDGGTGQMSASQASWRSTEARLLLAARVDMPRRLRSRARRARCMTPPTCSMTGRIDRVVLGGCSPPPATSTARAGNSFARRSCSTRRASWDRG